MTFRKLFSLPLPLLFLQYLLLQSTAQQTGNTAVLNSEFPPVLQVNAVVGYIEENSPSGTLVLVSPGQPADALRVELTDADLLPDSTAAYQYRLTGSGASRFGIDRRGQVYLNNADLDADAPNTMQYELIVLARETNTVPTRSSESVTLTIQVIDLNDNAPTFGSPVYTATVAASGLPREVVKLRATDNDSSTFGRVTYIISSVTNGGDNSFVYNETSGALIAFGNLVPGEQYQVMLTALDGGGQTGQTVILVTADQPNVQTDTSTAPVGTPFQVATQASNELQQFSATVNENTNINTVVMSLGGGFPPNTVRYSIISGNEEDRFRIDAQSGVLSTVRRFDRESTPFYQLIVEASPFSGGNSQRTGVVVTVTDANDNAPRFIGPQPISFEVRAGLSSEVIGRIILDDADEGENARVTLMILPPNPLFRIEQSGVLITNSALPNSPPLHQLTVVARDNGQPRLQSTAIVQISVLPDPALTTAPAPAPVTDSTTLSTTTLTTSASTSTSSASSPSSQPSSIPTTESSTTQTVRAPPVFVQNEFIVDIDENTAPTDILTVSAQYPDSQPGDIAYVMLEGDQNMFSLNSRSGIVSTLQQLDAEDTQQYQLIISTVQMAESTQQVNPANAAVVQINVVDLNDYIPTFSSINYDLTVADYTQPGTAVFQVEASDQDVTALNNVISYQLFGDGDAADYFRVDQATGMLTVDGDLSQVSGQQLTLYVEGSDGGSPSQSSRATIRVQVQATDSATLPTTSDTQTPIAEQIQFSLRQSTASIEESRSPPYSVLTIPVTNQPFDTNAVRCDIVSGNYGDAFSLSATLDGDCELRSQIQLDRESFERYLLNITVAALGFSDYSQVTVVVLDSNDNAPMFKFNNEQGYEVYFAGVSSLADELTPVVKIEAEDKDLGESGQVTYNLSPLNSDIQYFSIDKRTGEIRTTRPMASVPTSFFEYKVVARDMPRRGQELTNSASVMINKITDENRFVLTASGILPNQMTEYIGDLQRKMRLYTGDCSLIKMERSFTSQKLAADGNPGTDVVFYAIDPRTGFICKRSQFATLFANSSVSQLNGDMFNWFNLVSVTSIDASQSAVVNTEDQTNGRTTPIATAGWGILPVAFIILAALLGLGTCFALICFCCFWSKYKSKKARVVAAAPPHFYGPTPMFLPPSEKMYETQMLEMAVTDDDARPMADDYTVDDSIYTVTSPNGMDTYPIPASHQPPVMIPPPDYPNGRSKSKKTMH